MSYEEDASDVSDVDIDNVITHLEDLESQVDEAHEQREVRHAINMVERLSPRRAIEKYTTRDMAQTFVGGILLSLPLLVEDGVFDIAEWFADTTVAGVPVFFFANIAFVVLLTYGLIYWSDFRQVRLKRVFGVLPRRLVAVLVISFVTAASLTFLWGRHAPRDPSNLELLSRVTVVWAAAAFGGSLGDILPGESRGEDINEMVEGILSRRDGEKSND